MELALASLNRRWGKGMVLAGAKVAPQGLPTGISPLDGITGCGGLPRGRISRLAGGLSSGALDLGLALAAHVSRSAQVALVDFSSDLDPGAIEAYWGDLENCWLVRPRSLEEGWSAARALARAGVQLCLLRTGDWGRDSPRSVPAALLAALSESGASGLLLGGGRLPDELRERVGLELSCQRLEWETAHGDVCGLRLEVVVSSSHQGAPGSSCRLRIGFPRPYPLPAGAEALAERPFVELLRVAGAGR